MSMFEKGAAVVSRPVDGHTEEGKATGASYLCDMAGCTGRRVVVKWSDGSITRPCSKGMLVKDGKWHIM